jgi:hypothetical protein
MNPSPSDYIWDVFISYRHSHPVGPFVQKVFRTLFHGWLTEALNVLDARVFIDESAMGAGDPLPPTLAYHLRKSRCMVAICSPSYFISPWCLSEWESFSERERVSGVAGLIVPVKFYDAGGVAHYLMGRIPADFTEYSYIDEALIRTEAGMAFQRAVRRLAEDVARSVRRAPAFRPDWPIWTPVPPPLPVSTGLLRLSDAQPAAVVGG